MEIFIETNWIQKKIVHGNSIKFLDIIKNSSKQNNGSLVKIAVSKLV